MKKGRGRRQQASLLLRICTYSRYTTVKSRFGNGKTSCKGDTGKICDDSRLRLLNAPQGIQPIA